MSLGRRVGSGWFRLGCTAVAAGAFLAYLNSLGGGFVWDDHLLIVSDPAIKSWDHLEQILTSDFFARNESDLPYGYYRPLVTMSYLADFSVWGLQPLGFHLTNVLLHAACSVMVALVLLRLGWGTGPSLLGGLLFAVHPIHTESVAWIAGRTDPLAFCFTAAALLLWLSAHGAPWWAGGEGEVPAAPLETPWRAIAVALSVIAFGLALLAKEMSVVLIGWLVLIQVVAYRRAWRQTAVAVTPYLIVTAAYAFWRFLLIQVPMPGAPADHQLTTVLLSLLPTVARYIGWLLWPVGLSAYVQNPYVISLSEPRFLASVLATFLIAVVGYRLAVHSPRTRLGAGLLAVSFLPILNIVRVAAPADMGNVMAERFCYFPSFPLVALVALGFGDLLRRASPSPIRRGAVATLVAAVVAGASVLTVQRNREWTDELTFLTTTLQQSPTAVLLWGNLANYHLRKRDLGEAGKAIERAAALDPGSHAVLSSRALWYVVGERYAEAIPVQEQIVAKAQSARAAALNNLAYLYRVTGRYDEALNLLQQVIEGGRGYADVYFNIAEIHRARGAVEPARQQYEQALQSRPDDLKIAQRLADLELENGDPEGAEQIYRQMLRMHPNEARLLNNLALVVHDRGNPESALQLLSRAVALEPGYVNARINYAQLLEAAGRTTEAAAQLEEAVRRAAGSELQSVAAARLAALRATPTQP